MNLDMYHSAGDMHIHIVATKTKSMSYRSGGTAAAPGSQGISDSPFPYFYANISLIQGGHELNIGFVWKKGVCFNQG
ncbi:MAG: hypothetical protein PWP06_1309, partial [Candidatus Marinimicrobia bacterium]|nr:hypothetical protein [Candidatus Neomarinimicrobiota bacterium]